MSVRTDEAALFETESGRSIFSGGGFERPVTTPASQMIIDSDDMPPKWGTKVKPENNGPKYGHWDYASRNFCAEVEGKEKAEIAFELIMFRDTAAARNLLESTIRSMTFLPMTRLDIGWVGVMVDSPGRATKTCKALMFVERNVVCLMLVSHDPDYAVSNHWLISMARLQNSRIR